MHRPFRADEGRGPVTLPQPARPGKVRRPETMEILMNEEINYRSAISDLLGRPIPVEGELRVWLDDDAADRPAPEGWVHVRSVREACFALLSGRVVELSLDNDLNNPCVLEGDSEAEIARKTATADPNLFGTGFQVIDFLEEQHFAAGNPLWPRDGIAVHTANANARERMERSIEAIGRRPGVTVSKVRPEGRRVRHVVEVEAGGEPDGAHGPGSGNGVTS